MEQGFDSKDGLRELIEMRNKRVKGNQTNHFWSTMKELSNDEQRFGPFSTGSNSDGSPIDESPTNEANLMEDGNVIPDKGLGREGSVIVAHHQQQSNSDLADDIQHDSDHFDSQLLDDHEEPRAVSLGDLDDNENIPRNSLNDQDDLEYNEEQVCDKGQSPPHDQISSEMPVEGDDNIKTEPDRDPNVWYLPSNKDICTLEEIRRGQVINKTAPNECPVPNCGKKINEASIDPTPGTIASGLRTHVLFVHYGLSTNRKLAKKKKSLGWSTKRSLRTSPRKTINQTSSINSPSTSRTDLLNTSNIASSLNLKTSTPIEASSTNLNKKIKRSGLDPQSMQISSLQSLIQATGGVKMNQRSSPNQQKTNVAQKDQMNTMTSSLFSILAGLTQQQQANPSQQPVSKNFHTASGNNTINVSQCRGDVSKKNTNINNRQPNSSLLSLLNEKISGNVATSLQNQLKKSLNTTDIRSKIPTSHQNINSTYIQTSHSDSSYNGASSILNTLASNNCDNRLTFDSSMPLNSFVESIATKTGSNIGPVGIAEVKKMIEKFTTSLLYSSQTIADHYLAPFSSDIPQQKPEISASDVALAYKMMLKTHGQP